MKNLALASLCSLCAFTATAQSELKVSLSDHSRLSLEVDYKHFPKIGTSITVGDLPEGRHQIRIFQVRAGHFGREVQEMIYEGKAKTYFGRITLFELDPESGGINVYDENIDSFRTNPSIRYEATAGNQSTTPLAAQTQAQAPVSGGIADSKLSALKAKVDDINTDTRKMTAIKEGLSGERLVTTQVSAIMKWLGFESSREEFAEWAYPITIDKNAYSSLLDQFSYKENQDALVDFLNKQQ